MKAPRPLALCAVLRSPALVAVADSAANGFTLKVTVTIQAPPAEVYTKILRVGDWWDSQHTFSGSAHKI